MSPQSRHGRGSAGRRSRHRHSYGGPTQPPASSPAGAPSQDSAAQAPASQPEEASASVAAPLAESRRSRTAPLKKRKQHGTLYRWVAAYLPLLAILFTALAGVWVWVSFISPPPAKPIDRWQQIEDKWTPAREKARTDLGEHGPDFVAQLADYKAFYEATKGWVDEVEAYDRWEEADETGEAAYYVEQFVADGRDYLKLLKRAYEAKTPEQILTMDQELPTADQTWETNRALIRVALGLPAIPEPSDLPLPSADCVPVSSESPGASVSPAASGSAAASGSPQVTLPPCPAPTVSASASASAAASATAAPSASPSPS